MVFGHPANHPWKRTVRRARSCLSSPLPTAIVFANEKEDFCAKKPNQHAYYAWASDTLNQSIAYYLIKYMLALAGARSLTSSGNLSISFIQKNIFVQRYLIILKLYKLA